MYFHNINTNFNNTNNYGFNIYSFALNPQEYQPSGHLGSVTRLDNDAAFINIVSHNSNMEIPEYICPFPSKCSCHNFNDKKSFFYIQLSDFNIKYPHQSDALFFIHLFNNKSHKFYDSIFKPLGLITTKNINQNTIQKIKELYHIFTNFDNPKYFNSTIQLKLDEIINHKSIITDISDNIPFHIIYHNILLKMSLIHVTLGSNIILTKKGYRYHNNYGLKNLCREYIINNNIDYKNASIPVDLKIYINSYKIS